MAFQTKDWRDAASATGGGDESTPADAAAFEDLETRLAAYTDSRIGTVLCPEDFAEGVGTGSDDTVAFRDLVEEAKSVEGAVTVRLRPVDYILDGDADEDPQGLCHAIIPLVSRIPAYTLDTITWEGHGPGNIGSRMTVIKSNRSDLVYTAPLGPPSIMGSGTAENAGAGDFAWVGKQTFRNIRFELPLGAALAGIDGLSFGGMEVENCSVIYGTVNQATTPNTNESAFGIRLPTSADAGDVEVKGSFIHQAYVGCVVNKTDHIRFEGLQCTKNELAMGFEEIDISHPGAAGYVMAEYNRYTLAGWDPVIGARSLTTGSASCFLNDITFDVEHGTGNFVPVNFLLDENDKFRGQIRVFVLGSSSAGSIQSNHAINLRIELVSTYSAPPTVASGTILVTPPEWDLFYVSGSTTISALTGGYTGREITMIFTGTAQVTDGGNLRLMGNYTGGANRVLKLISDGTAWIETSPQTRPAPTY